MWENPVFNICLQAHWKQCCSHWNHRHRGHREDPVYGYTCVQGWTGGRRHSERHSGPRLGHDGHQMRSRFGETQMCIMGYRWFCIYFLHRVHISPLFMGVTLTNTCSPLNRFVLMGNVAMHLSSELTSAITSAMDTGWVWEGTKNSLKIFLNSICQHYNKHWQCCLFTFI